MSIVSDVESGVPRTLPGSERLYVRSGMCVKFRNTNNDSPQSSTIDLSPHLSMSLKIEQIGTNEAMFKALTLNAIRLSNLP